MTPVSLTCQRPYPDTESYMVENIASGMHMVAWQVSVLCILAGIKFYRESPIISDAVMSSMHMT